MITDHGTPVWLSEELVGIYTPQTLVLTAGKHSPIISTRNTDSEY